MTAVTSTVARAFLLRWRWYLTAALASSCLLWTLYFLSQPHRPRVIPRPHPDSFTHPVNTTTPAVPEIPELPLEPPTIAAGNSTLGFQSILALSPFPSWRTTGLQAAAQLTHLEITIPPQPPTHPEAIDAFISLGDENNTHPNRGSATAWLAHLDLIKHVVQSDFETVLILEDDVDWDLSIHEQSVAVAEAVRQLTKTDELDRAPYGHSWDVLWVGLCAETWDKHFDTVYLDDPTACPPNKYTGLAKAPMERLSKGQRVVFRSGAPICTFAYALTREGAKKVLLDVGGGKDQAFDIALMNGCRERNLTCISVLPELFHHHTPGMMGPSSLVNGGGQNSGEDIEVEMGHTENILKSARCHALWGKPCLEPPPPKEEPAKEEPPKEEPEAPPS
ncbi:hypothetical protein BJY04DRAFT_88488 [Aspergillus karnatakaensis]|uniref:uncharacterized protein n=1 Tax=Aspergillus karnatakaensis TaxID=1810916 RepID=UPI003CCD98AF